MSERSYFSDASMIRRVNSEPAVAFSGGRALLMQAAHPVAFAGFFATTRSLEDPYERLRRTAVIMDTIAFGPREQADRETARVRSVHSRIRGELTEPAGVFQAGTPYAADDPGLLLWILAALVDSGLRVYERYVGGLDRDERDAYWRDYRVVGGLFGLEDGQMPETIEDFDRYIEGMLRGGELEVTPQARALGREIVLNPPAPALARPLVELVNFITIGMLPGPIRRGYGFSWDPVRGLALGGGAAYTRRLLWPLVPAPLRRRAGAAMRPA
jgi:uncharacterized protein (DUF2236 family)